jgi:spermidine synthase
MRKGSTEQNPVLELFLNKGQWQLATADAVYSDGTNYRPVNVAFEKIRDSLSGIRTVLILGTGLASAVHILNRRGYFPECTLVDNDALVLQWAGEFMSEKQLGSLQMVKSDAMTFMQTNDKRYDLIIADIFRGRNVPEFVTGRAFMEQCRCSLNTGGHLVMNYIINQPSDNENLDSVPENVFPGNQVVGFGINKVFIARV